MKKLLLTACAVFVAGMIQAQNFNLTVAGNLPYGNDNLSNIWGFVDTLGNEYALIGTGDGFSVVDVTVPSNPTQVAFIPAPNGSDNCTWREVKTIGRYAYITTECGTPGLQIVDLRNLPGTNLPSATWSPTIMGDPLETIHALDVDGTKLYLYGSNVGNGGAIIADVSSNPMSPTYLGIYDLNYIHDGEVRNDTLFGGHIYDGYFSVIDVSNPTTPVVLQTQTTPGNFTHNTWTSTDRNYLFTTDEVNNSFLTAYDISNLGNIQEVDRIQVTPGSGSVVHNTYTNRVNNNDYEVVSWYKDGVVIVDVGRPNNMVVVGWNDIFPGSGTGMSGTWGVYPYLPSGNIVASNMGEGLYVLTPTYVRACYLEGVITDANTTFPIFNATVTISSVNITDNSQSNGNYATGYHMAGTYSVTYSKPGYIPQTISVALSNGVVTTQNVQLVPLVSFPVSGQVIQSWNSAGVPNAHVRIYNGAFTYDTITDANGNYTFPAVFQDTFTVVAGKWLYMNKCFSNVVITQSQMPPVIPLDSGIYDEFTWDYNWTTVNNANTGFWERGEPLGTTYNTNGDANPEFDVNNDCTDECYVTGNTGQSSSDDDVDGGANTLISPVFDLTAYNDPLIDYYRWFFNDGGFGNPNDSMRITISNGNTSATVELVNTNTANQSTWVHKVVRISSLLPITNTMQVRVRVVDESPGHLVEGAIDRFWIRDSLASNVPEYAAFNNSVFVYPNPSVSEFTVEYMLQDSPEQGAVVLVTDVTGRIVTKQPVTSKEGKINVGAELESGIYFVRITSGKEVTRTIRLVKAK